jgi:hypothetical protein
MPFSFDDAIPLILYSLGWRILHELQEKSKNLKQAECFWDSQDKRAHNELIRISGHTVCLFEYSSQFQWLEVSTPNAQSVTINHVVAEMLSVIDRVVAQSNINNSTRRTQVFSRPYRSPIEEKGEAGKKAVYSKPESPDKKLGLSMMYEWDNLSKQPRIHIWFVLGAYTPNGRNNDLEHWTDLSNTLD